MGAIFESIVSYGSAALKVVFPLLAWVPIVGPFFLWIAQILP